MNAGYWFSGSFGATAEARHRTPGRPRASLPGPGCILGAPIPA
jgi:hypothetical protein